MKRFLIILAAGCLFMALAACGGEKDETAALPVAGEETAEAPSPEQTPAYMPASGGGAAVSGEPSSDAEETASGVTESAETDVSGPDFEASAEPSAEPARDLPAQTSSAGADIAKDAAGTFVGSDGSVLTVESDGTCAYEVLLTGTVNGIRAKGRVVFHGKTENGVFSFDSVTYYGLDVTEIAHSSGYTEFSYWEKAAAILYAG